MKQYLDLLNDILVNGNVRPDRTGTGTRSVFGRQMVFDLSKGKFPLLTTKKMFTRGIIEELLWILSGDTNNKTLTDKNVNIWNEWCLEENITEEVNLDNHSRVILLSKILNITVREAIHLLTEKDKLKENGGLEYLDELSIPSTTTKVIIPKGSLGGIYGKAWRNWNGIDQISELIKGLKEKPYSRRHIVNAWNVSDLPDESISPQANVANGKMALAPCHCFFQMYVTDLTFEQRQEYLFRTLTDPAIRDEFNKSNNDEHCEFIMDSLNVPKHSLSCQLYQRSMDTPLGCPFNIASYALLTMMIAQCVNMLPNEFIHTTGDSHIYSNQLEGVKEQLTREPYELPTMIINPNKTDIFDFNIDDFKLVDYTCHPKIDYPIAI